MKRSDIIIFNGDAANKYIKDNPQFITQFVRGSIPNHNCRDSNCPHKQVISPFGLLAIENN